MRIYVLPISGCEFINQLGLLSELYCAFKLIRKFTSYYDYAPHLVLGSSGGNISAYIAMSADWNDKGIIEKTSYLECDMFISNWIPIFPSWFAIPLTGSLYRPGYGFTPFFKNFYTPINIQRSEVWTGTFNKLKCKAEFFCNKSENNAIIKNDCEEDLYCTLPYTYLSGNIKEISTCTTASASVPFLTQSCKIDMTQYADGGVLYASPLIPLSDKLRNQLCGKRLQLFYFCSYNMGMGLGESIITMGQPFQALIHSNILKDRNSCVDLLRSISPDPTHIHRERLNTVELSNIIEDCEQCQHFVIILYPIHNSKLEMSGFTHKDVINCINKTREEYGAHIWKSLC